ncbi:hypothetical protein DUNSADRAFT_14506 [Dunaliella salina]|uniref:Encoded protein n=1 Tax=Dunaliella salina TaxID=3046 RepID=A0ABQ7G7C1_DUNSA|nr:hypothetical protein DUNSADRAFT_14506 [Dunaliella salina]|eukprot:KAF5830503.1 hypothetical protein DUNSADRAFT_14506 [Dunaliella salina]
MDADLIVTLHTGDDRSPVAQMEWSTEDQPQRCLKYDWPQGRGGHSCCLVRNQVLLLLGYTGYTNKVYLPEVLTFEVRLPSPPKPVSPATTVGLAIPQAAQPEPLVTPALHHPAPVGPYVGVLMCHQLGRLGLQCAFVTPALHHPAPVGPYVGVLMCHQLGRLG